MVAGYELSNDEVDFYSTNEIDKIVSDIKKEFQIYPNPSTGLFNISFGNATVQKATMKILNLQGKLMQIETFQNTSIGNIDISALPKGIYIVTGIVDGRNVNSKICLE